ncbi:MAG TPA: hypothetical protein VK327_04510, partial [Candidatus Paceibacterota bacterium]|nr:hypothetical protein [Candidatus Paceibacterota bacterium]
MKKQLKAMLLVAVTGAAASTAQAAIYNGDLLIGFTAQSGNDFIYDLGSASSLVNGQTWDFSAFLAGFNLNTVSWGVIGDKSGSPRVAWTTTGGTIPATLSGNADWATLDTPTKSIYSNFGTAGAGQSLSISANDDNSWNQQTINGALNTQYHNAYGDPNVTGLGADSFFTVAANGADPVQLGSFSLGANGTLSYS